MSNITFENVLVQISKGLENNKKSETYLFQLIVILARKLYLDINSIKNESNK